MSSKNTNYDFKGFWSYIDRQTRASHSFMLLYALIYIGALIAEYRGSITKFESFQLSIIFVTAATLVITVQAIFHIKARKEIKKLLSFTEQYAMFHIYLKENPEINPLHLRFEDFSHKLKNDKEFSDKLLTKYNELINQAKAQLENKTV